jgi:CelD/BcsL family acetyltransferase involved in cellulose biosynthesis
METFLCHSVAELEEVAPSWKEVCSPEGLADHPFWTADWLSLWWKYFGAKDAMRWVVVREDGRLAAIAPLWRKGWLISCFGEGVSDYAGFLLPKESEEELSVVLEALRQHETHALRVAIDPLPYGSPTLVSLCSLLERLDWPHWVWPTYEAPAVRWSKGWEAYWDSRKAKLKANVRRRRRNLESLGEVTISRCESEEDLNAMWPETQRLHQARWHGRYTRSLYTHPVGQEFYKALAQAFLIRGWLDLTFLYLDSKPIAFHFGFCYGGRFYYYIPAFDPAYAAYAPSTQLLVHLLERSFEAGFEVFDFLIGDEPYKYDWATENQQTFRLVFPLRQGWSKTATTLAVHWERFVQKLRSSPSVRRLAKPALGRWQAWFNKD